MMKTHEAASLFPLLVGEEFEALCADIEKHGQQQPIYRFEGKIIDGRNRMRAAKKLKLDPWIEDLDPDETDNPFAFVMSMNFHRRHLSPLDKGHALKAYLKSRGGKKQQRKRTDLNGSASSPTLGQVAKELGIPKQTASRHVQVADDYDSLPKPVKAKVDDGELTVKIAKAVTAKTLGKRQADEKLPADVLEVFDKEAEKAKAINTLMTFLSRTEIGFESHSKTMKRRWAKAELDIICRHLTGIQKQVKNWRKTLCQ